MPVYVQTSILERIQDVFNADAIWQTPGLALFARRPLLRDLLERSPREQRGHAATRCFSHVVLMLPQEEIDDDYHLTRGARACELADALAALHQRDFGDMLQGEAVRYDVQGSATLAHGEVEVRFGHAVYLPAPSEKLAFSASISRDGANWTPVCPVYAGQRLALLGADTWATSQHGRDGRHARHESPGWPLECDAAILLLNDGPGAQAVVQMRPRGAYDCQFDVRHGHYVIRQRQGGTDNGTPLLLKITQPKSQPPLQPLPPSEFSPQFTGLAPHRSLQPQQSHPVAPQAPSPAVWQARPAPALAEIPADATALPAQRKDPAGAPALAVECGDATCVPLFRLSITLAALALPRLSRYRDTGASRLDVPFSAALTPCGPGEPALTVSVDADDVLYASTGKERQRIAAPATFTPVDARAIRILPPPGAMADRYSALLALPQPASVQLPLGGRHTFGRSAPALGALRVLGASGGLPGGASADRIGLSREAFSFEVSPQGVRIARLATSQALYHLDQELRFVANIAGASVAAPYLLPPGHHVVAGHYVLRFDA